MDVKVQIYALTSAADAAGTVDAGADIIGVACDNDRSVVEDCSIDETRAIFAAVEQRCMTIALSLGTDVERIVRMVAATRPKILHLAARDLPVPVLKQVRERIAPVKLMVAVLVDGPGALDVARERAPYADYIILDSGSSKEAVTGATGRTHDWNVSARIVAESRIPIVLAGGLAPDNVAEAVRVVRPWAVDSFTRTDLPGQRGRKDFDKVRAFARNARAAAAQL
ncbi:MAG: phosphoribosylanthranilate isomerase [Gammaproteobacteria bacterium]|nr:phosphoribosylanthranilate isomerase [Gammaproteobacteria bacterium]